MTDQPSDKKYYIGVDKSNGIDYTCTAKFYVDEKGRFHLAVLKLEPPEEKQQDET